MWVKCERCLLAFETEVFPGAYCPTCQRVEQDREEYERGLCLDCGRLNLRCICDDGDEDPIGRDDILPDDDDRTPIGGGGW